DPDDKDTPEVKRYRKDCCSARITSHTAGQLIISGWAETVHFEVRARAQRERESRRDGSKFFHCEAIGSASIWINAG
ncbi:MAG TPA: hypothetical protein VEO92_05635, partial [Candidatus Nitrosocosmicus sp.]|nr:hypothetical protein [Candidatus Nitrosocosmicus sp.]